MKLLIVHHHFRPGGVRRVIELATPHLVAHWPGRIRAVVLASGEPPDPAWLRAFRCRLPGTIVTVVVQPAFGYVSELSLDATIVQCRIAQGIRDLIGAPGRDACLIWAHNLGLGRNLGLARELARACHEGGVPLIAHHHDWWFENRWHHFAAMGEPGSRTLVLCPSTARPRGGAQAMTITTATEPTIRARQRRIAVSLRWSVIRPRWLRYRSAAFARQQKR